MRQSAIIGRSVQRTRENMEELVVSKRSRYIHEVSKLGQNSATARAPMKSVATTITKQVKSDDDAKSDRREERSTTGDQKEGLKKGGYY